MVATVVALVGSGWLGTRIRKVEPWFRREVKVMIIPSFSANLWVM